MNEPVQDSFFDLGRFERICREWQADHAGYLKMARALAVEIAKAAGAVSIDDLLERMNALSIPTPDRIGDPRIAGSILRGSRELVATGEIVMSRRQSRKAAGIGGGMIAVYRLNEGFERPDRGESRTPQTWRP